jgi:hypothetical protein
MIIKSETPFRSNGIKVDQDYDMVRFEIYCSRKNLEHMKLRNFVEEVNKEVKRWEDK